MGGSFSSVNRDRILNNMRVSINESLTETTASCGSNYKVTQGVQGGANTKVILNTTGNITTRSDIDSQINCLQNQNVKTQLLNNIMNKLTQDTKVLEDSGVFKFGSQRSIQNLSSIFKQKIDSITTSNCGSSGNVNQGIFVGDGGTVVISGELDLQSYIYEKLDCVQKQIIDAEVETALKQTIDNSFSEKQSVGLVLGIVAIIIIAIIGGVVKKVVDSRAKAEVAKNKAPAPQLVY